MHPRPIHIAIAVLILLVAGGILWFVLSREVPGTVITPGTTPTKEGHISDEGQFYTAEATYPTGTPVSSELEAFAKKEIERFKDTSGVLTLTAEDAAVIPGLGTTRKYEFSMKYEKASSPTTVSYIFLMYEDTLGAHPNAYYRTFTFDTNSWEEVHIEDLFLSTVDIAELLSEKTREILVPQIAKAYEVPVADIDRSMLDAGTTPYLDNFQNFYLEGDALVIVFPPYQVGPWALGAQEARIPKSEISSSLAARYR